MSVQDKNRLRPVKGEEWIERLRVDEFWIGKKHSYPEKLYSRLTKSYVGWWLYFRLHSIWSRASLLIDPLSCGGLRSHVRSFWFNAVVVDVWWNLKNRVWRIFHRQEWKEQCRFMDASIQALTEGYAGDMSPPPSLKGMNFIGRVLGRRYFERVAEILREEQEK